MIQWKHAGTIGDVKATFENKTHRVKNSPATVQCFNAVIQLIILSTTYTLNKKNQLVRVNRNMYFEI